MTTQVVVFALVVGWIGGWAIVEAAKRSARRSTRGLMRVLAGQPVAVARWVMAPAAVSLACGTALAAGALWRLAGMVTR